MNENMKEKTRKKLENQATAVTQSGLLVVAKDLSKDVVENYQPDNEKVLNRIRRRLRKLGGTSRRLGEKTSYVAGRTVKGVEKNPFPCF